ncbi:hypothetical protein HAX54_002939 [Datura stramonium]|uniref:Uncharacterized protein n=1 Tax=Datura stramonium TaxID=4076 RepID=A0ABS8T6T5_DATST|nr:hypothetical protein [Datura stramonium]
MKKANHLSPDTFSVPSVIREFARNGVDFEKNIINEFVRFFIIKMLIWCKTKILQFSARKLNFIFQISILILLRVW